MKYTINLRSQVKSMLQWFIVLATVLIIGVITQDVFDKEYLSFMGIFLLIFLIPCLVLHIQYFSNDRNQSLTISNGEIAIKKNGCSQVYKTDELFLAENHVGMFYKSRQDKTSYLPTSWSNYGYVRLCFSDKQEYYFTSLVIDPTIEKFPKTKFVYRLFPFISRKSLEQEKIEAKIEVQALELADLNYSNERFAFFMKEFSKCTSDKLEEKLLQEERFTPEAIKAAKKILEERNRDGTA